MKSRVSISLSIFAVLCILALCRPLPAAAVSSVTLSPSGESGYLLQGNGIEDAAAMEINISYDGATINNPRITEGPLIAGAMTAVNPNLPGTVRMVIIRLTPVRGSGVIAALTFDRTGPSSGGIKSLNVRLANIHGTTLPVMAQVSNPPAVLSDASDSSPKSTETSGTTAQAAGSEVVVVPLPVPPPLVIAGQPDAADQRKEKTEVSRTADRDAHQEMPASAEDPASLTSTSTSTATGGDGDAVLAKNYDPPSETKGSMQLYSQKSILELFREYRGERTAAAFIGIFRQEGMIGVRQEPPIALSDGETPVKVTFISTPGDRKGSDVAVMGARLVSLKRDPDKTNTWIAELIPEKDTCRASLAVSQGSLKMMYPLIVAPRTNIRRARTGSVSEREFTFYLNSRRTAGPSPADLNHDGRQDYVDDYIFTANYLEAVETAQRRTKEGMTGMAGH